jgi:uncharacterized protein YjeT (DUF2065 family)
MKKIRIFRDFNELSKRQQIAVGIFNTIIGIVLMYVFDTSMGIPAEISIRNIIVVLVLGGVFMYGYSKIQKRKIRKDAIALAKKNGFFYDFEKMSTKEILDQLQRDKGLYEALDNISKPLDDEDKEAQK